jgi:hypothetical protein
VKSLTDIVGHIYGALNTLLNEENNQHHFGLAPHLLCCIWVWLSNFLENKRAEIEQNISFLFELVKYKFNSEEV